MTKKVSSAEDEANGRRTRGSKTDIPPAKPKTKAERTSSLSKARPLLRPFTSCVHTRGQRIFEWMTLLPDPSEMAPGALVDRTFAEKRLRLDESEMHTRLSRACSVALANRKYRAELVELDTPEMRASGGTLPSCAAISGMSYNGKIGMCACAPARLVLTIVSRDLGEAHIVFTSTEEMIAYTKLVQRHCGPMASVTTQIYKAVVLRQLEFACKWIERMKSAKDDGTILWRLMGALGNNHLVEIPMRIGDEIVAQGLSLGNVDS